jgi:hypothetical protein
MRTRESFIVPLAFGLAVIFALIFTVSWVPHPVQKIVGTVSVGPPGVVPHRTYGLRFTVRNQLSGHILPTMVPSQQHCVNVTIANEGLTYVDMTRACRTTPGTYGLTYAFPTADDYVIFVEVHPVGGDEQVERLWFPLDLCWLRRFQTWYGVCPHYPANLRGQESQRSVISGGVEVLLGAPPRAAMVGQQVPITFIFMQNGQTVQDLEPIDGQPGRAVAISADTLQLSRLQPDPGQVVNGRVAGGTVTFTAWFGQPSIYRIVGDFRYRNQPLRASFVIDVNPEPTPTPESG